MLEKLLKLIEPAHQVDQCKAQHKWVLQS